MRKQQMLVEEMNTEVIGSSKHKHKHAFKGILLRMLLAANIKTNQYIYDICNF